MRSIDKQQGDDRISDKLEQAWIANFGENGRKEQLYLRYVEWLGSKELHPDVLKAYQEVGATHLRTFYPDHGSGIIPEAIAIRVEHLAYSPDGVRMVVPAQRKYQDWRAYYVRGRNASFVHVFVDEECFSLQGWK